MATVYKTKSGWEGAVATKRPDGAPWRKHFSGRTKEEVEQQIEEWEKAQTPLAAMVAERRHLEQLRASLNVERAELKKLTSAYNAAERYRETIRDSVESMDVPPLELPDSLHYDAPTHTWVMVLSDIHVGQLTKSETTGKMFEQNLDRVREQFVTLQTAFERLYQIDSKSKVLDELVVLLLGDLVEGDGMRPEQAIMIDLLVTKQTVEVAGLLSDFLSYAMTRFRKVRVHNVGGNHDRVSQRPGLAGLGQLGFSDTYAWLAGEFIRAAHKPSIDAGRLEIKNWESFFGYDIIAGQRTVFEHGASFKTSTGSYGGVPYYPITNAADKYRQMLDGADLVVFGHHHIPAVLPMGRGWQVLNGSFTPSTNYVQSSFKRVGIPTQLLLDLHPKFGLLGPKPIYLPHDGIVKPGEIWDNLRAEKN
jgi:predicted phosphodiesterase